MLLFSFRFCLLAWWCGGRFAVGGFTFRLCWCFVKYAFGCLSSSAFSYLVGERGEGEEGGLGVRGVGSKLYLRNF